MVFHMVQVQAVPMTSLECLTSRLQRARALREILQERSPQGHETKPLLYGKPVASKSQSFQAVAQHEALTECSKWLVA